MKYLKLTGICERAIKNNLCNGCSKLENPYFTGQEQCNLIREPIKQIKEILGIQEVLKL